MLVKAKKITGKFPFRVVLSEEGRVGRRGRRSRSQIIKHQFISRALHSQEATAL